MHHSIRLVRHTLEALTVSKLINSTSECRASSRMLRLTFEAQEQRFRDLLSFLTTTNLGQHLDLQQGCKHNGRESIKAQSYFNYWLVWKKISE